MKNILSYHSPQKINPEKITTTEPSAIAESKHGDSEMTKSYFLDAYSNLEMMRSFTATPGSLGDISFEKFYHFILKNKYIKDDKSKEIAEKFILSTNRAGAHGL